MQIIYSSVEGSQESEPLEIDTLSSRTTVYLRKNIEQITRTDENGNEYSLWKYDEAQLTKEEYDSYKNLVQFNLYDSYMEQIESQEEVNANILLNQTEILAAQESQDQTLADILLNTTLSEA